MNAKGQAKELREQAERTREALGDTVQQLSDKLDVQARASDGVQKGLAKAQQATASPRSALILEARLFPATRVFQTPSSK